MSEKERTRIFSMNKSIWKLLQNIGVHKLMLAILLLRAPFDFLNAVLGANMLEQFIRIMELGEKERLWSTFLRFLLLSVLLFAYNMTVWMTISINGNISMHKNFRKRMLAAILRLDAKELEEQSGGDWITRLGNDIDRTCDYLTAPLNYMPMFIALVSFVCTSVILMPLELSLFAVAIAVMFPFFFLSSVVVIRNIPSYKKNAQEKLARYTNWVEAVFTSHTTIRMFQGEESVLEKVDKISREMLHENMKIHRRMATTALINIFSGNLGYLLLLLLGNSMIGESVKDFAMLSKITQYRGEMMRSMMCINTSLGNMRTNLAGANRVEACIDFASHDWLSIIPRKWWMPRGNIQIVSDDWYYII